MTASARFAHTDYPADVEDLIAESDNTPSTAAVAGYAILASHAPHALIFAIAAGSGLDAVPLALQPFPDSQPPSLALWQSPANTVSAAALTTDAVLRVFRHIDLRQPAPSCEQIRVSAALSSDREIRTLSVVHVPALNALMVFGAQSTAALVTLGETLSVHTIGKDVPGDRSSRIGSLFYSAFKSIGVGVGRDDDWVMGTGSYELVGTGVIDETVVLVRRCGDVERWGKDGMIWSFSVFDHVGGRDARKCAVGAGTTADGTVVVLVDTTLADGQRSLVCFDAREGNPAHPELVKALDERQQGEDEAFLVVSGEIAYVYTQTSRDLSWTSVARGVSSEGQVLGRTMLESDVSMFGAVDASFGLQEASVTGGVAACLHKSGVWLASSAVPAPVSLNVDEAPDDSAAVTDTIALLWRAFLQHGAGQFGAAKASLRGLVRCIESNGVSLEEALSDIVQKISRKIVSSQQDPDKDPMTLLIDTELEKKQRQHNMYLQMLSDGDLFAALRSDAPSIAEDRIWDAIKLSSRSQVLADNEKLSAANKVREIENMQPGYTQRFNDAASSSFNVTNPVRSSMRSIPGTIDADEQDKQEEELNVLKSALVDGGGSLPGNKGISDQEVALGMYRFPFEFHRFLPALDASVSTLLTKLQSDENMTDRTQASRSSTTRRASRNVLLLACEAAVAVTGGSHEAREENAKLFSRGRNRLNGVGNWICDYESCRKVLFTIAERTLQFAERSTQSDQRQLTQSATIVVDELLNCASLEAAARGVLPRETGTNIPQKRRRVDLIKESSEWGRELRSSLDMLRCSGLDEEAFTLAEKYGDFGMMLSLRESSANFNNFFASCLQRFGDEFAFYSFRWLEERGKIDLLLRGRSENGVGRSERVNSLLCEYFQSGREPVSNLSWMHWLSMGNVKRAANDLLKQLNRVSEPEKAGSTSNTRSLASFAKLAVLAIEREKGTMRKETVRDMDYASSKLLLTSVQGRVEKDRDALLPPEIMIRRLVNEGSAESEQLAQNVIAAIEAVHACGRIGEEAANMEDFVWRRCVERQSKMWMPLAQSALRSNDIQLREQLMSSALFIAARSVSLTAREMNEIIERGTFECTEFATNGCVPEVTRLVRATVALGSS